MKALFALLILSLSFAACSEDDPVTPTPETSLSKDVKPIFTKYGCASCHGGSGGLFLTSVATILQGGDHGSAVIAGNPDGSLIIQKISDTPPFGDRMPQGGAPVSDADKQTLRSWIQQGAKDN